MLSLLNNIGLNHFECVQMLYCDFKRKCNRFQNTVKNHGCKLLMFNNFRLFLYKTWLREIVKCLGFYSLMHWKSFCKEKILSPAKIFGQALFLSNSDTIPIFYRMNFFFFCPWVAVYLHGSHFFRTRSLSYRVSQGWLSVFSYYCFLPIHWMILQNFLQLMTTFLLLFWSRWEVEKCP